MPDELPTSIRIDPETKRVLREYAHKQGASFSWFVVDILKKWLAWKKREEIKTK